LLGADLRPRPRAGPQVWCDEKRIRTGPGDPPVSVDRPGVAGTGIKPAGTVGATPGGSGPRGHAAPGGPAREGVQAGNRSRVEADKSTERHRAMKLLPGYFGRSDRRAQRHPWLLRSITPTRAIWRPDAEGRRYAIASCRLRPVSPGRPHARGIPRERGRSLRGRPLRSDDHPVPPGPRLEVRYPHAYPEAPRDPATAARGQLAAIDFHYL
jgi:hypothetical protein